MKTAKFYFTLIALILISKIGLSASVQSVGIPADNTYIIGQTLTFTVTFDEAVTVTGNPSISIQLSGSSETVSADYDDGTGTETLTFTYTVSSGNLDADGIELVSPIELNGGSIKDSGENDVVLTFTSPSTTGIKIDGEQPTATIALHDPATSPTNSTSLTFRITFSEPVYGFTIGDVTKHESGVTGSLTGFSGSDGDSQFDVTATSVSGDGTFGISILAGVCTDEAGNTSQAGSQVDYSVDNDSPNCSIALHDPATSPTNSTSLTFRITFSEPVYNFVQSDITIHPSGVTGSLTGFSGSDGDSQFDVTFTSVSGNGTFGISLAAGVCEDALGNPNEEGLQINYDIDQEQPTATIALQDPAISPTNSTSLTFRITFSEPVYGFTIGDVTKHESGVTGSLTGFSGSDGDSQFDVTFTSVSGDGTFGISVAAGVCEDALGNPNEEGLQINYDIDQEQPTATIALHDPATSPTNSTSLTFRITFSEPVYGFAQSDITIHQSGVTGSLTGFSGSDGDSQFDVTFTSVSGDGTFGISVGAGVCTDEAENTNQTGEQVDYSVDNDSPTCSIALHDPATSPTNSTSLTFRITFSEPVYDFTQSDITIHQSGVTGNLTGFSGSDGDSQFDVTFTSVSGDGTFGISVAAGVCEDALGNPNEEGLQINYDIDQEQPTATIALQDPATSPTNSTSLTFRITFNKPVYNFTQSDITIHQSGVTGSLTGFSGSDGDSQFDVTFTSVSGNGTYGISVAAGVCEDILGNLNEEAAQVNYTIDQVQPTTSIARHNPATSLTNSTSLTFRITFSEPVYGFTQSDVTTHLSGVTGSLTGFSGTDGDSQFDVTFTSVSGDGTFGISVAVGVCTDEAGNTNTVGSQVNYTVDQTDPYVSSINRQSPATTPTNATTLIYRVTFSENVSGIGIGDFELTISGVTANISSVSATNGTVIDVTVGSVSGNGTIRLDLKSSGTGIVDDANNPISGGFTLGQSYTIDQTTLPPTLDFPETGTAGPNIYVDFSLPENAFSETVKLTFTRTGGTNDNQSPHILTLISDFESLGQHTTTINGLDLVGNPDVLSVDPGSTQLVNATIYSVKIEYEDELGNTSASNTPLPSITYSSTPLTGEITAISSPRNTNVNYAIFTFSSRVLKSAITTSDFTLTRNSVPVNISGATITFSNLSTNGSYAKVCSLNLASFTALEGFYEIRLNAATSGIRDVNNNYLVDDVFTTWTMDLTQPTVSIIDDHPDALVKHNDIVNFTASFVEANGINEVTPPKISIGAALSNQGMAKSDNLTWSYEWTVPEGFNGDHSISISATDNAGNANTPVTGSKLTFTIDNIIPTLSPVTIKSNNSNPIVAGIGDEITVDFTADEIIQGITVTIADKPTTLYNIVGNRWAAFNVVDASFPDLINFQITCYDIAGNQRIQTTSTDGSSVSFDNTPPEISSISITSINDINTLARVGDEITITFDHNEPLKEVNVKVYGTKNASSSYDDINDVWTATYIMASNDVEGTIPFTIIYKDLAGNSGTAKNQDDAINAVEFDRTKPTLDPVAITSNNTLMPQRAGSGHTIMITFTTSEPIQNPSATIQGQTANISPIGGNEWMAEYELIGSEPEGQVFFVINFADLAGNDGNPVNTITEGSGVTFDKTPPMLTSVSILSDNLNSNMAIEGNEITLSFTASEEIQEPTVSIALQPATVSPAGGNSWTASYTIQETDPSGLVAFEISYEDVVGNTGAIVTSTTNGSSVTYDKTAPELTTVTISSNYLNTDKARTGSIITVTFTASEVIENVTANILGQEATPSIFSGNTWKANYSPVGTEVEGEVDFNITFFDLAGNEGSYSYAIEGTTDGSLVEYDKTPPVLNPVTIFSDHSNTDWARVGSKVTVEFESDEHIEFVSAKINTKNAVVEYQGEDVWQAYYFLSSSDTYDPIIFTIDYKDLAGNPGSQVSSTTDLTEVNFDKVKPFFNSVTIYSNNAISSAHAADGDEVTLEFETNEDVEEPELTHVTINGIDVTSISGGPTNWVAKRILLSGENEGIIPLTIDVVDLAGNEAITRYTTTDGTSVTFDDTQPGIVAVTVPSGIYKVGSTIPVFIQADNNNYIGETVEVNLKPQTLINNNNNTYSINYVVDEGDNQVFSAGSLPVNIVFRDAAGNTSSRSEATSQGGNITVDARTPQILNISSNAQSSGILKIGDELEFTLTTEIAEEGLIITPTTYNAKPLTWIAIDEGAKYVATYFVTEGDATQTIPLQIGTITIADAAGNIGTPVDYVDVQKSIYATRPTATILGTTNKCDYGQTVPVTFQFTGYKPFELIYSNGIETIGPETIDGYTYQIDVEDGTYSLVSLIDSTGNITNSALQDAIITVRPLPVLTLDINPKLFRLNDDPLNLVPFASPVGGTFFGNGVGTNSYFYPSVVGVEGFNIDARIYYTHANEFGCRDTVYNDVVVSSGGAVIDNLKQYYCQYDEPVVITGSNPNDVEGEFWVSSPIGWEDLGNNMLRLEPALMVAGKPTIEYTVIYKYFEDETPFQTQRAFKIDSIGKAIDFGILQESYCEDAANVSLSATNLYPFGGTGFFTGPEEGLTTYPFDSNIALFGPSALESGTYTIEYYYLSPNGTPYGCSSDTISYDVTIHALPEIDFDLLDNYNYDGGSVELIGDPSGGIFSGTAGLITNNILYPDRVSEGPITVNYTYTNPETGCTNNITKNSIVRKASEEIEGVNGYYHCYSDDILTLSCVPIGFEFVQGTFSSSKGAVSETVDNQATYSIIQAGFGEDIITYGYFINETYYEVTSALYIDSIGPITINNLAIEYCNSQTPVQCWGSIENAPSGNWSFTYSGNQNALSVSVAIATFAPDQEVPGDYEITFTYTATASGCIRDTVINVTIHPLPEVSIVNLPEYYNIDAPSFTLEGNPSGGEFSGPGVQNNIFTPTTAGQKIITYTYTDGNTCTNSISDTIVIIGVDATIHDLPEKACIDGEPIAIYGTSNNGLPGWFIGNGITQTGDNTAVFDPSSSDVEVGINVITYQYPFEDDPEIILEEKQTITVYDEGVVTIFNLEDDYCFSNSIIELNASPNSGGTGIFSGGDYIAGNNFLMENTRTDTLNPVIYTFTGNISGCTISGKIDVTVYPVPEVDFEIEGLCSDLLTDSVQFWNTTTIEDDSELTYEWVFLNHGTSDEENPKFLYTTAGLKIVTLTATSENECSSSKEKSFTVGLVPKASFTWFNECLTGNPTLFTSTNDPTIIETYRWEFEDQTELGDSVYYQFTETGYHDVKLVIKSTDQCLDSLTKQIYIQPHIRISELAESIYYQDFEQGKDYWDARPITENQYFSWDFGNPEGSIIDHPVSGENAWFTVIDLENQIVEKSQVLSPCFDLSLLDRPMLKFNIWSSPNIGRDGAVIQYDLNSSGEWQNLGAIGDGIEWFNSSTIESQPGGQFVGWSSVKMDDWVSARISLDAIKESPNVRFRVAYATNTYFQPEDFDGFAFDDFWIGNRQKDILLEYFTNNTSTANMSSDSYMVGFENENLLDLNAIHYHTSSPVGDPLHSFYPTGPSAREFFYGVSSIPYALINGTLPFNFTNTEVNQSTFDKEILRDPLFQLSIDCQPDNGILIGVEAKALSDYSGKDLAMHCAIVQKEVDISNAPSGVTRFYNVLRDFVPNSGGVMMSSNMDAGDIYTQSYTWNPSSAILLYKTSVIAFIQDIATGEVYQSVHFKLSNITYDKPMENTLSIDIYPNPVSHTLWIDSPIEIEQVTIYDLSGRALNSFNANSRLLGIPMNNLKNGVYIIKLKTRQGEVVKKFVKQ